MIQVARPSTSLTLLLAAILRLVDGQCENTSQLPTFGSGVIKSPNYTEIYAGSENCSWNFNLTGNNDLNLTITKMDFIFPKKGFENCTGSYNLTINRDPEDCYRSTKNLPSSRCEISYNASQCVILLEAKSCESTERSNFSVKVEYATEHQGTKDGFSIWVFKINYTYAYCPSPAFMRLVDGKCENTSQLTTYDFGVIKSPNYTEIYGGSENCSWNFNLTGNNDLNLTITKVELIFPKKGLENCTGSYNLTINRDPEDCYRSSKNLPSSRCEISYNASQCVFLLEAKSCESTKRSNFSVKVEYAAEYQGTKDGFSIWVFQINYAYAYCPLQNTSTYPTFVPATSALMNLPSSADATGTKTNEITLNTLSASTRAENSPTTSDGPSCIVYAVISSTISIVLTAIGTLLIQRLVGTAAKPQESLQRVQSFVLKESSDGVYEKANRPMPDSSYEQTSYEESSRKPAYETVGGYENVANSEYQQMAAENAYEVTTVT